MSADEQWSITAEIADDGVTECVALKIGCPRFEANFWISFQDLAKLKLVREMSSAVGSIQIGRSANALAYWSRGEADLFMIVIGNDDETWDIGFSLPADIYNEIIIEIEAFLPEL